MLVILVSGGIAAQASGALGAGYAYLLNVGSSKPLPPLIHRADRLTVAQAQQQIPFSIVDPIGLPPHTTFQYAHVISHGPVPNVALYYQTQIDGRYYRIIINETTAINNPPVPHFEVEGKGKNGRIRVERWTLPFRLWKHVAIFMQMLPPQGLPPAIVDRIARENTLCAADLGYACARRIFQKLPNRDVYIERCSRATELLNRDDGERTREWSPMLDNGDLMLNGEHGVYLRATVRARRRS